MPDTLELERQLNSVDDPLERVRVLTKLCKGLYNSHLAQALRYGEEARALSEAHSFETELLEVLTWLGWCHYTSGDYRLALETLERALGAEHGKQGAEKLGKPSKQHLRAQHALACAYERLGDFQGALALYQIGLEHTDPHTQPREYADNLNSVAIVYMELNDHLEGMRYFRESLEHYRQAKAWTRFAGTSVNLGVALKKHSRDPLEAEKCFLDALEVFEDGSGKFEAQVATTLMNLGSLYVQVGRTAEARSILERALTLTRDLGLKMVEAYVHQKYGKLHMLGNQLEDAETFFLESLMLFGFVNHTRGEMEVREDLAQLYHRQGKFEAAFHELEALHTLERTYFDETSNKRLRQLQARFEVDKERREAEIERLKTVELENLLREKSRLVQQLEQLSITDGLTGLFNRRYLDAEASRLYSEARTGTGPLCISLADIDFFKRVNDSFGHAIGDEVLRKIALIYRENTRANDLTARYGGEEFALVMPFTELTEALEVCERVRVAVENFEWSDIHPQLVVTLSLGGCAPLELGSHEKMLQEADHWLYQAKHEGKNRVRFAPHAQHAASKPHPLEAGVKVDPLSAQKS